MFGEDQSVASHCKFDIEKFFKSSRLESSDWSSGQFSMSSVEKL